MLKDLLYAIRMLRKTPGFVAVAVFSLAIGIGANSAIYSFAAALLIRPLPVFQPGKVVTVSAVGSGTFTSNAPLSYPDYVDLRDRNHTFDGLVAWQYGSFGFTPDRHVQPRIKYGLFVSGNFFQVLGVKPLLGRGIVPDQDKVPGRDPVAVISHELWTGEFASDPSVIGRKILLSGTPMTIIGVTPENFRGLEEIRTSIYVPMAMASVLWDPARLTQRDLRWLNVKGRLRPGVGLPQARADLASIASALRHAYPKTDESLQLKAETEFQFHVEQSPPDTALMLMLQLLAVAVLLVACANVAGLLLSRATVRAREMSVKLAIGAGRWTLVRQLLIESLLLSFAGALAGLGFAYVVDRFLNTLPIPTDIPLDLRVHIDERVVFLTLFVAVASTFIFGLAPAVRGTKLDLITALKEKDATASRPARLWGRNLIVGGQVALSLVLLIISGVLFDGFRGQLAKGPGFRTDHLQLMNLDPGLVHYTEAQRDLFYKKLVDSVRAAPGVESAALATDIPMSIGGISTTAAVPVGVHLKRGEPLPQIMSTVVSSGYFATLAIPVVKGRPFLDTDKVGSPLVAIVNQQMARHYWPHQDPIGKQIRIGESPSKLVQVIGVAKQSKYVWISEAPMDFMYLPFLQNPQYNMYLIAQSKAADAATLMPVLRSVMQSLDPNIPLFDVRTMESLYRMRAVSTPNMLTNIVGGMGLIGLVLSAIGLYGVISYSVTRRIREFGIRMAVGADRSSVVAMVLRQGSLLALGGIFIGLICGVFVSHAITSLYLFVFNSHSIGPYVVVSGVLLVATMLGAYFPALRASRVDPMRALREE